MAPTRLLRCLLLGGVGVLGGNFLCCFIALGPVRAHEQVGGF